jgi:hypothetical protein
LKLAGFLNATYGEDTMANLRAVLVCRLVAVCAATSVLRAQQPADSVHRDSAPLAPAILIGRVTDSLGAGLVGAEITLLHSDRVHAITSDSGDFRLTGLEPGTLVFNVRRIGFEAANHYFFVPLDLVEKALNCRDLLERWLPEQRAKWER